MIKFVLLPLYTQLELMIMSSKIDHKIALGSENQNHEYIRELNLGLISANLVS
jgi:hypothetical protein